MRRASSTGSIWSILPWSLQLFPPQLLQPIPKAHASVFRCNFKLGFQPVTHSEISALLKTPLGTSNDLFQLLDICERYTEVLIENKDIVERMALCGRLYAGLEVLKVVLDEQLREYCSALTIVLLNQQESAEQQETITGLLFEMVNALVEDLKAPRFIRTDSGLAMIDSQAGNNLH